MRMLVSACLMGIPCRYDGNQKACDKVLALLNAGHVLIPVCPEQLGGLCTPRIQAEIQGSRVITYDKRDVTAEYERGAQCALTVYRLTQCECACLKARSPSCGAGSIYDGTFSGTLIPGDGIFAALLRRAGIPVKTEEEL